MQTLVEDTAISHVTMKVMADAVSKRFENETKAIYDEFSRLLLDEKAWHFEKEEAGCKISSIMTEKSTKSRCFKCECKIEMAPQRTIDTIHPFGPYRKEYDANYISSQVIEELSPNSVIGQFAGKTYIMGIGFSGDYINSYVFDKTNDYFYSIYGSIKYDKETPKGIGLRGWMHPSGFAAFKTDDPNVTNAVVIWHSEFQALPGFLVKSVVEKASIAGMIQYIENLRMMKDKPYEPLTKDVAMCRNR